MYIRTLARAPEEFCHGTERLHDKFDLAEMVQRLTWMNSRIIWKCVYFFEPRLMFPLDRGNVHHEVANGLVRRRNAARGLTAGKRVRLAPGYTARRLVG